MILNLIFWIIVFIGSLALLIKAADIFTKGAEIAGLRLKINPFIIGVTIVSIGTSLPELITSFIAISKGELSIVAANAVGSNIANILLIVGISAVVAVNLKVERSLIDLDAPLLAITTAMLVGVLWDKQVFLIEAIVLLVTYGIYLAYTIISGREEECLVSHKDNKIKKDVKEDVLSEGMSKTESMSRYRIGLYLLAGVIGVYLGAELTIRSVVSIGGILNIATSIIAITAIALGTSLPELVVSVTAARKGNYEIALGNVFGSNIFNSLVVIGLPGLFTNLSVDVSTATVGLFFMVSATIIYVFSGISMQIHKWEGLMYLALYALFVIKVFAGGL